MNRELKQRLQRQERVYGMMLSELYVPNLARLIARCGYDFVLIDCEHGYFDLTEVANIVAVAEGAALPVLVRIAQPSKSLVTKILDMGARGIVLANTGDAEQARAVRDMCLYAPLGDRGISTMRAHTGYQNNDTVRLIREANERVLVICQIESPQAAAQAEDILAVEGVDGLLIGPNDLSQHLGIFGQYSHPTMIDTMRHVAWAARDAGKWSGIITGNESLVMECTVMDMTCFCSGSELSLLAKSATEALHALRALVEGES